MMFVDFNDIFVDCLVSCPKELFIYFSLGVSFGVIFVMEEKTSVNLSEFPTGPEYEYAEKESRNFLAKTWRLSLSGNDTITTMLQTQYSRTSVT
jgi:hypothetical protein